MVKDILREIKGRKLQFLAILLITMLGVGFYIGISVTGYDMRLTADAYMQEAGVLDLSVMSAYGIDDEMKAEMDELLNSKGEPTYSTNVYASSRDFDNVINIFDLNSQTEKDITLSEGKIPNVESEVLIDTLLQSAYGLEIGDELYIKENDIFESETLKIVGIGTSSSYLNKSRGFTNLGAGEISGFAYAKDLKPKIDIIPSLRYDFEDDVDVVKQKKILEENQDEILKNRFQRLIQPELDKLKEAEETLAQAKIDFNAEISSAEAKIVQGEKDLEAAKVQLEVAIDQLVFGLPVSGTLEERLDVVKRGHKTVKETLEKSIADLQKRINESESEEVKKVLQDLVNDQIKELATIEVQFTDGYNQVEAGVNAYYTGLSEIERSKIELENGKITAASEFSKAEEEIKNGYLEIENTDHGDLHIFERKDAIIGYTDFYNDSERIEAIGSIFPLIFFGVAILITLSTLTQMIDESRNQLGIYKALGFTSFEASMKYVGFAFVAWFIGITLGILLGFYLIPNLIYNAYRIMYETPDLISNVVFSYLWIPLLISFMASVGVALFKALKVSSENAASLLRPPLPKSGQRILLERWPWLWSKVSFLYKVSFRNLFRNKTRFLMTVIGIAGCSGLLITGFGISHSINSILDIQFGEIFLYDGLITYTDNSNLDDSLYESYIDIQSDNVKVKDDDVTLYISDEIEKMPEFFGFINTIDDSEVEIDSNFVAITEKIAEVNDIGVNDTVNYTYKNKHYTAQVSAIIKNHAGHFMFMSEDAFEESTHITYKNNVRLISEPVNDDIAATILEDDKILNVTLANSLEDALRDQMSNFDIITLVVVGAAFLLELIVLTNLISMNISERQKELATLKVLGFYPNELSAYILRENIMMTLIALIFGIGFGVVLHKFVIFTAEIDMVMFNRELNSSSIIVSIILTLVISLIVNYVMSKRSNKVDMNEALKTFDA